MTHTNRQVPSSHLPETEKTKKKKNIENKTTYIHLSFDYPEQTINSISRSLLNEKLVEEALLVPNIRIFFEHKPQTVDFHRRLMNVYDLTAGRSKQVEFDLCIGADGSHSFVRRQIMRVTRYVFSILYCHPSSSSPWWTVWMLNLDNWVHPFIRPSVVQNGLSARVHSSRIYGAQDATDLRRGW